MLSLNINGTIYNNANSCKLYNLSAQELYSLDIYIITEKQEAQNWLLSTNSDLTPKIKFEIDRYSDINGTIPGQIFDIKSGNRGESFSNPIIYKREDRLDISGNTLDDSSHIQKLPSHNAIAQLSVKMIGGSDHSKVQEKWGKVRAVAPINIAEDGFYKDRSEWYINLATRDDSIKFNVIVSNSTNLSELDLFMKDIIIIIQPSQHQKLKKNYMYYDTDNEPPRIERTGVIY